MGVCILSNEATKIYEELFGTKPTDVEGQFNLRTNYYRKRLMRRLMSTFELEGVPEDWDVEWMKQELFMRGYVCIANTAKFGVIPLRCTFSGINVYNRPTECIVSNHLIDNLTLKINKDCVVVKLQYNYQGVWDLLAIYSHKLAAIDSGIEVNIMNSKAAWMFDCDGKAQEETAKKIYDEITAGRPAVFRRTASNTLTTDGKIGITMLNVKNTYIADMLQDEKREVRYEFLSEIGINNANVDKKERVNTLEVSANDDELRNAIDDWKKNLTDAFTRVNSMFGLNIRVVFPYYREECSPTEPHNEEGGEDNGND